MSVKLTCHKPCPEPVLRVNAQCGAACDAEEAEPIVVEPPAAALNIVVNPDPTEVEEPWLTT